MRFILAILVLLIVTSAQARTWRVKADQTGDAPTIQAAIDSAASTGDLILVAPGTYHEKDITFMGKDVWLKSDAGPTVTIIDGDDQIGSIVIIISGESRNAILDGFTITGGRGGVYRLCAQTSSLWSLAPTITAEAGGMVIVNSSPTVRNNVFLQNHVDATTTGFGGAMSIVNCLDKLGSARPLIQNNLFLENTSSTNGGAIAVGPSNTTIENNVFIRNYTGPGDGGAIWAVNSWDGSITIRGNQFWENEAYDHGGAIEVANDHTAVLIEKNLFVRNKASGLDNPSSDNGTGGAISARGAFGDIKHNTFVSNDGSATGTGGSILVANTLMQDLTIDLNIFSESAGYAIRCNNLRAGVSESGLTVRSNLFWNNVPGDVDDRALCLEEWQSANLFGDPRFCGADADNYTVAENSPALTNGSPIGAFWIPGCGEGVPVEETTWGKIKAMYHEGS